MRKTVDEINTVIKRHGEENTVIKRHDEENPVIERHDEENPIIERHDEESSVVERHDEVEAHSEDCNQLIEVQMADTLSLDKSVPGPTSDEPSPRIITLSDNENTNADKVNKPTSNAARCIAREISRCCTALEASIPWVDLEPARLHILNCLAEAYRKHDQILALPDSTDEPTKRL
ncbi:hypothetical protein BDZ91DRAFT_801137 [Kalaharituber pfeilii]|nr:hypothetical protein BDZ91DRAFT_801137 [Kalaharituber pfeilii]